MPEDVKARGLSRNVVVDTALRVADEEGLEALSLRRLARALDVTPMAIYRHVRNNPHLLDLMADRLLERIDLAAVEPEAWTERLWRLLGSYQAVAAEHPAAPLLLARPFSSPTALRISETLLEILHAAGFETAQAVRLFKLISGMLLGPAIPHRAFWAEAARRRPTDAARQEASIEAASGASRLPLGCDRAVPGLVAGPRRRSARPRPVDLWTTGARGPIRRPLTLLRLHYCAPQTTIVPKAERLGPPESARQPSRESPSATSRKSAKSVNLEVQGPSRLCAKTYGPTRCPCLLPPLGRSWMWIPP